MSRTRTAKIVPPASPAAYLPRPALTGRLDYATGSAKVTVVVAGAGFGKSTLLGGWASHAGAAWYALDELDTSPGVFTRGVVDALRLRIPGWTGSRITESALGPEAADPTRTEAIAASICEAVEENLTGPLVLVLDDVHEVGAGPTARLIEAFCRQAPANLHVVISSREQPPFPLERMRGRGQVADLDARSLAFALEETEALAETTLGDPEIAGSVQALTGGWPAGVRLAIEALRPLAPEQRQNAVSQLARRGSALFAYLAEEVFAALGPGVLEMVRRLAYVRSFSPELCAELAPDGADAFALIERSGLFSAQPSQDGWLSLTDLTREFVLGNTPLSPAEEMSLHLDAARWFAERGRFEEQVRHLMATQDAGRVTALLAERGAGMLAAGGVDAIIDAAGSVPEEQRDTTLEVLLGQALQVRGDWTGAMRSYRRAAAGAETVPAGLAWRMGLISYLSGALAAALEIYARGGDGEPADVALLAAWTATAHWARGEGAACRETARRALELAEACGDLHAVAAAHTALAMSAALDGDRPANAAHYVRALDAAERANDVLQVIRIRTNRASAFTDEGSYDDAQAEIDIAIGLAELAGFASFEALGLHNRGEVMFRRGRLDEARRDFEASRAVYQRIGSAGISYPLNGLGDVHRERGDLASARVAYEEALRISEPLGNVQGFVPALAGLALVICAEEPERAADLAARARRAGGARSIPPILATAWIDLRRGCRTEAATSAAEAASAARARRNRAALAEALELEALTHDGEPDRDRLEQAATLWRDLGNPLREERVRVAIERLNARPSGPGAGDAAPPGSVDLLSFLPAREPPALWIQTLGSFRVYRNGEPVAASEWQSKKARDMLKLLISRRGRPLTREAIAEVVWPDEDPEKVPRRLSVALVTVRQVLDPAKRFGPDHHIVSSEESLLCDVTTMGIDVETFMTAAQSGLRLSKAGQGGKARTALLEAESLYRGDFLEEDLYEEYAVPLREEARAVYAAALRALAEQAAAVDDHDAIIRYRLRLLEKDAFDEEAHLGLVMALSRAGRHGEARRAYRGYVSRMEEIAVEAVAFPVH